MKHIYILFLLVFNSLSAQIAISDDDTFWQRMDPRAAVHIDEGNTVVKFPHVVLNSIDDTTTVTNPTVGLMVYNKSEAEKPGLGFCYWDGIKWVNYSETKAVIANNISTKVSINALGYNPVGVHSDASREFTISGTGNRSVKFTRVGCVRWKSNDEDVSRGSLGDENLKSLNGNDHYYCGYTSSLPTDWGESFKAAKAQGAYMVTITSSNEWEFILNSFYKNKNYYFENGNVKVENLDFRRHILDTRRVWIGYNKSNIVGHHQQFAWITGESSEINWITGERYSGFAPGEPNDSGGVEGCSHIHYFSDSAVGSDLKKLSWNDTLCNLGSSTNNSYKNMSPTFHIFEFNQ